MQLLQIVYQDMQTIMTVIGIVLVIALGFIFYLVMELKTLRREVDLKRPPTADNSILKLQAYERLNLFTNRISLKNLVSRSYQSNLNAAEFKAGLIDIINQEFEHNLTQQNYVSPEIWKAVCNMKDQNKMIINQLSSALPETATAMDLSRMLLQYADAPNAEMGAIVLDAIQFEVKKLV